MNGESKFNGNAQMNTIEEVNVKSFKVRTSSEEFESFDKSRIINALIRETNCDSKIAEMIANDVERIIEKINLRYLTAPLIREIVNAKLIEYGLEKIRERHTRVGLPVYDITKLIKYGSRENANLQHNPETIHKWVADASMKEYSLLYMFPKYISDAHIKGDIHLHDLEYAPTRPVCLQHDLRPFFKYGLKVDGTGLYTSISKPAKHPEVAIQHAAKVMMAAQTNMSGGQSIDEFNVWLAPYVRGLEYEKVKQLMQMFIYELNQMYVARGGQVIFSSINLEFSVPDFLKDKPAVIAGTTKGTYEEYEEESRMILKALVDVMIEGDAIGKFFLFPNTIFKVRSKKNFDDELMEEVHKLIAKFGTPYFINMIPDWQVENTNAMGCRTRLSGNWTGDPEIDTLRTGNMQWYSINLPRIAYEAKGDDDKLFEILHERLNIVRDALIIKHQIMLERLFEDKIAPFLTQEFEGEMYYRYDHTTKTIGFVGLNEMLKYHLGEELHESSESVKFGEKVIRYIRDYADKLKEETGLRWTVTQTPAESTAGRFARLDLKYFTKEAKTVVNGSIHDINSVYYSNSSHVRVDAPVNLGQKLKIEEKFHPLCNGGHIFHIWNIEAAPDYESLMGMTKKICMKSQIGFFAYTKNLTVCNKCHYCMGGLKQKCSKCNSDNISQYSRITGYMQNISNWNKAKQCELKDRRFNSF